MTARESAGWPKVRDLFRQAGGMSKRIEASGTGGVPDVTWLIDPWPSGPPKIAGFLELKRFVRWEGVASLLLSAPRPAQNVWMRDYAAAGGRACVAATVPSPSGDPRRAHWLIVVPYGPGGPHTEGLLIPLSSGKESLPHVLELLPWGAGREKETHPDWGWRPVRFERPARGRGADA